MVKVPDLEDTPLSDARRKLEDAGLKPGTVERRFDEETARGSVLATDPEPGSKRRPGAAVALTVSKGAPVEVPDVVGDKRSDATEELEKAGLKVRIATERVHSEHEKGSIARQSPTDGARAAEGDTVTLTVSKGPDMIEVPDVEGSSEDEATEKLEGAGFEVTVRRIFFGDTVFNQSPRRGREGAPRLVDHHLAALSPRAGRGCPWRGSPGDRPATPRRSMSDLTRISRHGVYQGTWWRVTPPIGRTSPTNTPSGKKSAARPGMRSRNTRPRATPRHEFG